MNFLVFLYGWQLLGGIPKDDEAKGILYCVILYTIYINNEIGQQNKILFASTQHSLRLYINLFFCIMIYHTVLCYLLIARVL